MNEKSESLKEEEESFLQLLERELTAIHDRLSQVVCRENEILINFYGEKPDINEKEKQEDILKCRKNILLNQLTFIKNSIEKIELNTNEFSEIL